MKDKNDHVIVVVPPSGVVIDASVRDVSGFDVGDCIVVKHEKRIEKWLKNIKGESFGKVILGDKAAAIAYPEFIYYFASSKSS